MRLFIAFILVFGFLLPAQASFEDFQKVVQEDLNIPDHFKFCFLEGLDARKDNLSSYQEYWAYIKANPPLYLDDKLIQLIEGYAKEADVPLTTDKVSGNL